MFSLSFYRVPTTEQLTADFRWAQGISSQVCPRVFSKDLGVPVLHARRGRVCEKVVLLIRWKKAAVRIKSIHFSSLTT
jgi:hypothetical protein